MRAKTRKRLLILGAGAGIAAVVVALTASSANDAPGASESSATGLDIVDGRLVVRSWDAWMAFAPEALEATLAETDDVDEIVANLFRRAFPMRAWPPEDGELAEQWRRIVGAVGRSLQKPFRPHLEAVS